MYRQAREAQTTYLRSSALAVPVPTGGRLPASLQLVGPDDTDDVLCATGLLLERAAASLP
jgi:Asp-tRNA(Asn)/Glu-tRNA(Gln) amidotransferase A subunit family amidase